MAPIQHPVITISRRLGCLGTEAGFRTAQTLGWAFCDRRILRLTAERLGISAASLERQEEHRTSLFERICSVFAMGTSEVPYSPLLELPVYSLDLFRLQADLMRRLAGQGPSVFVGRGGFVALADWPRALHVSIQGSVSHRIRNLMATGRVVGEYDAMRALQASDEARGAFIREISGLDWNDPDNFDIAIDSSGKHPADIADEIVREFKGRFV